ncbi:hypothetical protein [Jannaschia sp. W003]|uniref:hypothetical protein n=1 Tax=Jannaschia sp. W003 TaxID=2867012 RepID=UPI0021A810B9|nr:hypothetical protein [Jannaschia sp. W003]UWQ22056.1 hypothetical protein K3554_03225 [Jannaschia sp. W003]
MKTALLAILALVVALPVQAACYADYKAKRNDPLRLHYGVIQLDPEDCDPEAAAAALRSRLDDGWELLQVVDVFDDTGLDQRRASAGPYFLRY